MSNSNKTVKRWLVPLMMMVLVGLPSALLAALPEPVQKDRLELGKKVYFKRCVWCHGVDGGGDGPSADRLFTRRHGQGRTGPAERSDPVVFGHAAVGRAPETRRDLESHPV